LSLALVSLVNHEENELIEATQMDYIDDGTVSVQAFAHLQQLFSIIKLLLCYV